MLFLHLQSFMCWVSCSHHGGLDPWRSSRTWITQSQGSTGPMELKPKKGQTPIFHQLKLGCNNHVSQPQQTSQRSIILFHKKVINYAMDEDSLLTTECLWFQVIKLNQTVPVENIYTWCAYSLCKIKHKSLLLRKLHGVHRKREFSVSLSLFLQLLLTAFH